MSLKRKLSRKKKKNTAKENRSIVIQDSWQDDDNNLFIVADGQPPDDDYLSDFTAVSSNDYSDADAYKEMVDYFGEEKAKIVWEENISPISEIEGLSDATQPKPKKHND